MRREPLRVIGSGMLLALAATSMNRVADPNRQVDAAPEAEPVPPEPTFDGFGARQRRRAAERAAAKMQKR